MKKLRVLIADDHDPMRTFIFALLCKDFQVVGAVQDGQELVRCALCLRPDVIVTDISMPQMDGLAAKSALLGEGEPFPFIFVSTMDKDSVLHLHKDAYTGFVYKGDMASHLSLAVEAVYNGRGYLSPLYFV